MANCLEKYFFILILFIASFPCDIICQRNLDPQLQEKIESFVRDVYLPSANLYGLGLTIVQNDGEVLYTNGFGFADTKRNILAENGTQFCVASITKSFTSILVAKLLHQTFPELGEAALDTPISKLLPEAGFTLIDRFRSEYATFRDLLTHRSCLYQGDLPIRAAPFETRDEMNYGSRYEKEYCGFRSEYQYNNRMFSIAGDLAGILANKSYEDAMQDLFDDLGMVNSAYPKETDDYSQMTHRALPHYVRDSEIYPMNTDLIDRIRLTAPAGGLFTSPDDMARYMRFILNFGNLDGRQIVPKEVIEWILVPSNVAETPTFKRYESEKIYSKLSYGLGLFLGSYDGWEHIHHTGHASSYRSLMSMYPAKNLAIFTTTNMGPPRYDSQHYALHETILQYIENHGTDPIKNFWKLQSEIKIREEQEKQKSKKDLDSYLEKVTAKAKIGKRLEIIGKYGSGSAGEAEVSEKFNENTNRMQYYLEYGKWFKGWLTEVQPGVRYRFSLDTDAVQDEYVNGDYSGSNYAVFLNETLQIYNGNSFNEVGNTRFELGLRVDLLPPIPWDPQSCGPEAA